MLIPIAIAINIILGQTVAAALKVPIYLDSIGTILVGVLAGPIAGAITGGLANLIWTYVLPAPFHSDYAAPFFIVAVEIGICSPASSAGSGSSGAARTRRWDRLAIGAIVVVADRRRHRRSTGSSRSTSNSAVTFFAPPVEGAQAPDPIFVFLGWAVALLLIGAVLGLLALPVRPARPRAPPTSSSPGSLCGIISAIISAPISAVVFGGVTGSGTDLLVAAFQKAG